MASPAAADPRGRRSGGTRSGIRGSTGQGSGGFGSFSGLNDFMSAWQRALNPFGQPVTRDSPRVAGAPGVGVVGEPVVAPLTETAPVPPVTPTTPTAPAAPTIDDINARRKASQTRVYGGVIESSRDNPMSGLAAYGAAIPMTQRFNQQFARGPLPPGQGIPGAGLPAPVGTTVRKRV
jgi:hypothetical protein